MNIAELIEIAVAGADEGRVEIAALEPAKVALEAVSGLSQLVAELVDNALAFSDPADQVRVTGLFEGGNYLISISDRGVGIPEHLMAGLNAVLDDPAASVGPEPNLGIALVARLGARLGIGVSLVPGVPGTTARVTLPPRLALAAGETEHGAGEGVGEHRLLRDLEEATSTSKQPAVTDPDDSAETTVDLTSLERSIRSSRGVVAMSDEARKEAESFLEKVFGPLMSRPGMTERPPARPGSNGGGGAPVPPDRPAGRPGIGHDTSHEISPGTGVTVTELRVRVPGANFSLSEDDPSTVAAERAIDIRSALSRYAQGRKAAQESSGEGPVSPTG